MRLLALKDIVGYYLPLYKKNGNVYCYVVYDRWSYFAQLSYRPEKFFDKENIIDTSKLTLDDMYKVIKTLFEENFK